VRERERERKEEALSIQSPRPQKSLLVRVDPIVFVEF